MTPAAPSLTAVFESWCDLAWDNHRGVWIASLYFEILGRRPDFMSIKDPNPLTALACVYEHANDVWIAHAKRSR